MGRKYGMLFLYFLVTAALSSAVILAQQEWGGGWLPTLATAEGKAVDDLFWIMTWGGVVILSIVMAIVLYAVIHWRVRPGDKGDGPPIHGHATLEFVWTAIPAVIVLAITVVSGLVLIENEAGIASNGSDEDVAAVVDMKVTGYQFGWSFDYLRYNGEVLKDFPTQSELVLPVDALIRFRVTARENDVIHSFWVPEARIKQDAVPGISRVIQWTFTKTGDKWQVVCAELCGGGHAAMRSKLRVVSLKEFDAWMHDTGHAAMTQGDDAGATSKEAAE